MPNIPRLNQPKTIIVSHLYHAIGYIKSANLQINLIEDENEQAILQQELAKAGAIIEQLTDYLSDKQTH